MMEETVECRSGAGRGYMTDGDKRDAELDRRNRRRNADMRCLAQQARCFVLPIRMLVSSDLQQKDQGRQG